MRFSDEEYEVLQKYFNGAVVEEKDRPFLEKLRQVGLIKLGMKIVEKDGKLIVQETAKLSPLGQTIFKEDRKQRSKLFKYFLRFFTPKIKVSF
jgi:hypothetical protein